MDNLFFEFYKSQNDNNRTILEIVLHLIEQKKGHNYNGMKLRTTKYRANMLNHYLTDLDGTLMIDLLYKDMVKLI
jgi:hypothetical protein